MKKTVLIIVVIAVTFLCIVFGIFRNSKRISSSREAALSYKWKSDSDRLVNQKLGAFSSIIINTEVMDLVIEEGNDFSISCDCSSGDIRPVVSEKNGALEIYQNRKNKFLFGFKSRHCHVVITIPSNTVLESIELDSNVGDVKLRRIKAKNIQLKLNVGEISVRNTDFDIIDAETNVGEISIDTLENIESYDLLLSSDVGEINASGKRIGKNFRDSGNKSKKISARTNVGEININD